MSNILAVLLNGIAQLEYDREIPLTEYQQGYIEAMDTKMDVGINIDGQDIERPDINQRVQFVAANMLNAMKNNEEGMTSALCSYIASRLPDLKQIKIHENDSSVTIDLVFDDEYSKQAAVQFTPH